MTSLAPFVSVIITTYNRKELVSRAAVSVLTQTYENIECIVVDDCSTDGTLDYLTQLSQQDQRIRIISHKENRHLAAARNTGIYASLGEFVAFLDDDDMWLPQKLEKQIQLMESVQHNVGLVYCWFDTYSGDKVVGTRRPNLHGDIFDHLLLSQPLGNGSTLLVRKQVFDHVGGFDESLSRGIDGDFIRRVAINYEIEYVPEVLVHYFVDHDGHPRITGNDKQSILNGIHGHEVKLTKFLDALLERPRHHAALYALIGRNYARLGKASEAYSNLMAAYRVRPYTLYVHAQTIMTIIDYLFRRIR